MTRILCLALLALSAGASELVYTPVNPTFGGSPLNGSYLLGMAQANNHFQAATPQESQLQQFNKTLQQTILSRIASSISSQIVDSKGNLIPGELDTQNFSISIVDLGNGTLKITTTDKTTGESTSFEVSSSGG